MYYTRGIMHTTRGDSAMEMGAVTGNSDKAVLVQVLEENTTSFDESRAQLLLAEIKGFPSFNK